MNLNSILCIDVETTGLDPKKDSVIEIGCVWWSVAQLGDLGVLVGARHSLVE